MKEREYMENFDVNGKIIIKRFLEKQDLRTRT
jgi:hypothetical protein